MFDLQNFLIIEFRLFVSINRLMFLMLSTAKDSALLKMIILILLILIVLLFIQIEIYSDIEQQSKELSNSIICILLSSITKNFLINKKFVIQFIN